MVGISTPYIDKYNQQTELRLPMAFGDAQRKMGLQIDSVEA